MSNQTREWPGTPLRDEDLREGRVLFTQGIPNAKYAWDTGVAIGRYLAALKEGRILGIHCPGCNRTLVPPRVFCELCFRPLDEWVFVQDRGTVNTFSISYITWDAKRVQEPTIPAVIELDGASKGMGILHLLGEVDPKEVRIGMRVRAVWKAPQERTGSVTDIEYFKPE